MKKPFGFGLLLSVGLMLMGCHSQQGTAPTAPQPAAEVAPPMILTATVPQNFGFYETRD